MAKVARVEPQLEKSLVEKLLILAIVVIPFVALIYAIVMLWNRQVGWLDIALMVAFHIIAGLGITIGFHRLLTHKSFETHPVIKAVLLIMGCMAVEGNPINWASTHIQHHAHSDDDDDPHSPLSGLWHAHIGWLFKHTANPEVYGTWLRKDPVVVWVDRYWVVWVALGLALPFAIGGWSGLIWGGLVRMFMTHHITWSVNSICHTFGSRPYKTTDASRNNFIVGLLAFGEGWHNNHHAFPRSAFHGLRWWQIDPSAYIIRALAATGLAWNIQQVRPEDEHRRNTMAVRSNVAPVTDADA